MSFDDRYELKEVVTGAIVVVLIMGITVLAYAYHNAFGLSGYPLYVHTTKADGLSIGTPVRISGLKIGEVSGLSLDPRTYLATVRMNIQKNIKVPANSFIEVNPSGFFENPYVAIHPGNSKTRLRPGSLISKSYRSEDLMSFIGKLGLTDSRSVVTARN